ncbi:monothiol glutaredoxin-S12, chloroplastic [Phalaenopsis equestris]|uniref:monothiol glutaredoxin-S12, chloroplastic n=1 Tax=Phalaenopsis equestris TaxID=78828 RepID=UPI0009E20EF0|nr:monothiol glutaredoxin-S12, chloroplastic [Phalaenopsis equestris]
MASTVQLSGFWAFYFGCPQSKTLALPLASSSAYSSEASSLRSVILTTRRRRHFVRSTTFGSLFVTASVRKLSETELVPISSDSDGIEGLFPPGAGVYGVYDKNGDLQFIGISRNVGASIAAHSKMVPVLCCSVKVGLVDGGNPDKTVLTDAWKSWLEEHLTITGKIPPGNQSGNNTWVSRPQTKPDLRLTRGRHVQLSVPLEELIDRLVKENEVVAFIKGSRSAPQCGFSQRVISILESHGVNFESVDVLDEEHNYGLRETLKKYSNWPTFPQVFVRGELVGGCDIISSMAEKGEFAALFGK